MKPDDERQAWVELPPRAVMAADRPPGHPYDFGFVTGMGRLLMAHPRIARRSWSSTGRSCSRPAT